MSRSSTTTVPLDPRELPTRLDVPPALSRAVAEDYHRFAAGGLPEDLDAYLAEQYRLELRTEYAGCEIPNPWGKASGQLSMTVRQVEEDVEAGLGFVVLKTVIACDEAGTQSMQAWAVKESRMVAERIVGASGEEGWTISWKGRGWWLSFEEYLQLVRDAQQIARGTGTLIVPSCKYHLPTPGENSWKTAEYDYTTRRLLEAWGSGTPSFDSAAVAGGVSPPQGVASVVPASSTGAARPPHRPMPLEKDFSPTLAGSDRAAQQAQILEWLRTVPRLVREAAERAGDVAIADDDIPSAGTSSTGATRRRQTHPPEIRLGLKLFNALFDDEVQLDMLRTIHEPGPDRPDFFVYANRLFDPAREFEGHRGIAVGGPDLSGRNLRVMSFFQQLASEGQFAAPLLPWSATGNITTGRMALEYALRGASSFQLHTFFQLPAEAYAMKVGSRIQKALHELCFHPETGLIVWMHHVAAARGLPDDPVRFRDIVGLRQAAEGNRS